MRKFWGFYDNGKYKAGCNGQTLYLYDAEGNELAKFRDIPYAYGGAFKPQTNIFVLRSTEGRIAVYDCDARKLLYKFRYSSVDGCQDDFFCFSRDSEYLLNIERSPNSLRTRLSIYETQSFSLVKRLFDQDPSLVLDHIECSEIPGAYDVLFSERNENGIIHKSYIGMLAHDQLIQIQPIPRKAFDFLASYKSIQAHGFTEKAMSWSGLHYMGYTNDEILKFKERDFTIAAFPQIADEFAK